MFSDLMARISREAVSLFYKIQVGPSPVRPIQETMPEQKMTMVHGESPDTKPEELKQAPIQKVTSAGTIPVLVAAEKNTSSVTEKPRR